MGVIVVASSKLHNFLDLPVGKLAAVIAVFLAAPALGLTGSGDALGGHGSVVGVVDAAGGHFRLQSMLRLALLLRQEELPAGGVALLLHLRRLLRLLALLLRIPMHQHPHPRRLLLLGQSAHLLPQGLVLHLAVDETETKIAELPLGIG
jgi:hypothetical protein